MDTLDQLRVNAAILAAIKYDEPKGFRETMRARLVGTKLEVGTLSGVLEGDGQEFINRVREKLEGVLNDIPKLGVIEFQDESANLQRKALRAVLNDMVKKPTDVKVGGFQVSDVNFGEARNISKKLILPEGAIASSSVLKGALMEFIADEQVAACTKNAANVSCSTAGKPLALRQASQNTAIRN